MSFDKESFEEQVINDMRELGGVNSSGPMAGTRLLVLTTTGARTGERRRALLFWWRSCSPTSMPADACHVVPGPPSDARH